MVAVGHLGDHQAQHGVAEELEPLVAGPTAHLRAPAAVLQRALQQCFVTEPMSEAFRQFREIGLGQRGDLRRP